MDMKVPPRITRQDIGFEGLTLRQVLILTVFVGGALVVAFVLKWNLVIRSFIAVLMAGSGVVLAYKTIQGDYLGVWAVDAFKHYVSPHLKIWRRGPVEPSWPISTEVEPQTAPRVMPRPRARPIAVVNDFSLVWGMVNVLILALLSALAAYMATGGSQDLILYFNYIHGR